MGKPFTYASTGSRTTVWVLSYSTPRGAKGEYIFSTRDKAEEHLLKISRDCRDTPVTSTIVNRLVDNV